jgi:hypothetical protein
MPKYISLLRRTTPVLVFGVFSMTAVAADSAVCDSVPVTRQIVWTPENGPHWLRENLEIPEGTRLVIAAGTQVYATLHGAISVKGELRIEGSAQRPVILTAENEASTGPSETAWRGIHIEDQGSADIRHAVIRDAGRLVEGGGEAETMAALTISTPCAVRVTDTTVSNSRHTGIFVSGPTSNPPRLFNVKAINNVDHGVLVYQTAVDIRGSLLDGNGGNGLKILHTFAYTGPRTVVLDSDLTNNGVHGVYLMSDSAVPALSQALGHRNNIVGNGSREIGVWYTHYLRSGKSRDAGGFDEHYIDWTDNYFGEFVFENSCPWSTAPGYAPSGYLSFEPQHDFCSEPPNGPVSYQTHAAMGPTPNCRVLYCGVNQVKVTPHSLRRFPRSY